MLFSSKSGCLNIKNLQAQATIKCCTPIAASTPITIRFQSGNDSQLNNHNAHKKNVIHWG